MIEWLRNPWTPMALVGAALVIHGTVAKTRWGINLRPPKTCPKCGVALRAHREPKSHNQFLWGGWTCSACGAEMDKWGRQNSN